MIGYYVYCNERPGLEEVTERLTNWGFQKEESNEWPLRLLSVPTSRPIFLAGKKDVVACYAPKVFRDDEKTPPLEAASTFHLSIVGNGSIEDLLFLGLVSGNLGTAYRGVLYDPLSARVSPSLYENRQAKPDKIKIPEAVWEGIEAIRQSGLTNMLERNAVKELAQEFGFHDTARWVDSHRREYAEGIFRGFEPVKKKGE